MDCPLCRKTLLRCVYERHAYWRCPSCKGALLPFGFLERFPEGAQALKALRGAVNHVQLSAERRCPVCIGKMRRVFSGGGSLEIESCDRCKVAWFDHGETRLNAGMRPRFSPERPSEVEETVVGNTRRQRFARRERDIEMDTDPFSASNLAHLTMGDLPMFETPHRNGRAIATYVLLTLCLIGGAATKNLAQARWLVWFPHAPWRGYGITWITSLFGHAGAYHALINCYFLWIFGENSEQVLGHTRFVLLFLLSGIAGNIASYWGLGLELPHLGASAAVAGVGAYFVLAFPHARVAVNLLRHRVFSYSVNLPVGYYAVAFLATQLAAIAVPGLFNPHIGYHAHLGGALCGVLFFLATRDQPKG